MYSTYTDTSVLDVNTADSITRYQGGGISLSGDYFDIEHYPHLIDETYSVVTYTWDAKSKGQTIEQYADLSNRVVGVNYDCDSSNNVKTSINLTLLVTPDDDFWYSNREYDISNVHSNGGQGNRPIIWTPQLYHVVQKFEVRDENSSEETYERDFGFFVPNNTGYAYDNTTSQLSIQLVGLSYMMTAEGGGTLITALRSYEYSFDYDYNHNPRVIRSYYSIQEEQEGHEGVSIAQIPVVHDTATDEKEWLLQQEESAYQQVPQKANVFGTAEILYGFGSSKTKKINVPLPLSISGEDGFGSYKIFNGGDITRTLYSIVMCDFDVIMNDFRLPLTGFISPSQDSENVAKSDIFPNGWDFDCGSNMMDIAQKILQDRYYEPMVWIDEDRKLCVDTMPPYRSAGRITINYCDYGELVIGEDISINDDNFYSVVEVYGKDGEFYGVADGTFDGFKTPLGTDISMIVQNQGMHDYSMIPKVKTITDESLESDQDCYNLAVYELWKSTRGNTTITVKVRDNCIKKFDKVSHKVGTAFVEYKLMQGDKTMTCILKKASLSNGVWTWTLEPFSAFAPSYTWYNRNFYWRWKTAHYDQFMAAKWNEAQTEAELNPETGEYVSPQLQNTLSQPAITNWEIVDGNILRLYIEAVDIEYGVAKLFLADGNGAFNTGDSIGMTSRVEGKYRIFDFPISQNGIYTFSSQLYSPYYEPSNLSESVTIYVGHYINQDTGEVIPEASLKVAQSVIPKKAIKDGSDDIIYNPDTDTYYVVDPETQVSAPVDPTSTTPVIIHHRPYLVTERAETLINEASDKLTV